MPPPSASFVERRPRHPPHSVGMDIARWVAERGGIVHRQQVLDAGASVGRLRAALARGDVARARRYWVRTEHAPPDLVVAARATARLACVSAARHRGWWMPPGLTPGIHLCVKPGARPPSTSAVVHWSQPLVPRSPYDLIESVEDTLEHVAECLTLEQAEVVWESATRIEHLHPRVLRAVAWRGSAARAIAEKLVGLSDSGLETLFVVRIRAWGVLVRQQVRIAGHAVDVLIGEWLITQLDGWAYHSSPADRQRDLAHDRELGARGYTVLRFTYSDVVTDWARVERAVSRAIAQGRHLRPH